MTSTTETRNESQQPECLGEKRYEVVLDFGKPSSEKVATLEEVRVLLKTGYELFQKEGQGDVQVFDKDFDISDSQVIQEMLAEIIENKPTPQCKLYPEAKCCPDMCEAGEKVACGLDPGFPEEDHNIYVEESLLEAMEEEPGKQLPVPNTEGIQHRPADMIFPGRREAIQGHTCMICKGKVEGFKDELSQKEYLISGLCQECQDKIFKEPEDIPNDSRAEKCKERMETLGDDACTCCPCWCDDAPDPDSKREPSPSCTYGDGEATSKCAGCGKPLCPTCGFKLGDDHLCNACFELDPR